MHALLTGVGDSRRAFSNPFRVSDCVSRLVFLVIAASLLGVFSFCVAFRCFPCLAVASCVARPRGGGD